MHGRLHGAYLSFSGVACKTLGVYEYLLPRQVPSTVKETLCRPWNDPSGATENVRLGERISDKGR